MTDVYLYQKLLETQLHRDTIQYCQYSTLTEALSNWLKHQPPSLALVGLESQWQLLESQFCTQVSLLKSVPLRYLVDHEAAGQAHPQGGGRLSQVGA